MAVRNSNLYEHKGLAKPLLSLIALLIIGEPKENEQGQQIGDRDPDAGYCTATQNYLAAQSGCSESDVLRWIKVFIADGWFGVETRRNKLGYPRNRYYFPEGVLKKIRDRAMPRDEQGRFIREKNPNKARKSSYQHRASRATNKETKIASRHGATRPGGSELSGLAAPSGCPDGTEPLELVLRSSTEVKREVAIANANSDADTEQINGRGEDPSDPRTSAGRELPCNPPVRSSPFESETQVPRSLETETPDSDASVPSPTHDSGWLPSRETEPARWLANYLWCFLSVRKDVDVPRAWEKLWTGDFQEALDARWSVQDVKLAIKASQVGRAREFYKRGASIVAQLELLADIGEKLDNNGLLREGECIGCHGLFVGLDVLIEHQLKCYDPPIDPADAAEEEAMDIADEMINQGYVEEHPDMGMYYPWAEEDAVAAKESANVETASKDDEMFYPWPDY
ncbi:MAG TPA: hypothetical protein VMT05_04825 [Terriglobales bacterium]|nr:hypothetical protein [Terriglobales bacterium]